MNVDIRYISVLLWSRIILTCYIVKLIQDFSPVIPHLDSGLNLIIPLVMFDIKIRIVRLCPNLKMCKYEGSQDAVDYNKGGETNMGKEMGAEELYTIFGLKGILFKDWNVRSQTHIPWQKCSLLFPYIQQKYSSWNIKKSWTCVLHTQIQI